jgi:hypothetical protein
MRTDGWHEDTTVPVRFIVVHLALYFLNMSKPVIRCMLV